MRLVMRVDPEIEEQAMEAARQTGSEKDYSYWKELYLRELERKARESDWRLNKILLWIAGVGIFLLFIVRSMLHW